MKFYHESLINDIENLQRSIELKRNRLQQPAKPGTTTLWELEKAMRDSVTDFANSHWVSKNEVTAFIEHPFTTITFNALIDHLEQIIILNGHIYDPTTISSRANYVSISFIGDQEEKFTFEIRSFTCRQVETGRLVREKKNVCSLIEGGD